MKEEITVCPRNCYSTCTFRVQVENNTIRRILPFEKNLATPEGPCIKGLSYIERSSSADRIIYPQLRSAGGGFRQISSEEAISIISERLLRIRSESGPHSILWYRGSGQSGLTNEIGNAFWSAFGGATTTYGNLCWPAGLEAVRLTLGSVMHNVPWDLENARTIIIWGKNPAETNIQEIRFIANARNKGCRVVVIDPVRTPSADKADLFISPKTGTDAALALAIAAILVKEDMVDRDFIAKHVKGFELFASSLTMSPSKAAEITGVPEAVIHELAHLTGRGGPLTLLPGYGLQRHLNGGQTIRAILALAVITGNIGKSGAGFNYANLQSYVFDRIKEPESYYPDDETDRPFRRKISMTRLGTDMLSIADPGLRAAWVERGNPLLQSPDSGNVRKAFAGLDFKVVIDQFMTDTAETADIILPAKDIFEQPDITGSYWSPYVQFKPAVLEPMGEVKPESEIYYLLARKMNMQVPAALLPEPGNDNITRWLEKRIEGYTHLTLDDLRNGPVLAPGLQMIAYEDKIFCTPSGKIELFSETAARMWNVPPLPDFDPDASDANGKYPLSFITPNTSSRIHSQFGNLNAIRNTVASPGVSLSPADARSRGITEGCAVRVFNERGEIISRAVISNRVPKGTIVLPNGIWISEGGGGNFLVSPEETDMGFGAAFHDTKAEIERV
ncbi:MAG: molybdopterin-dependent oxidoreductase [Bacteroidales bacterium]|nr:molybdopterin-dependent oxidoreductase [Bacteroidales bacterium]